MRETIQEVDEQPLAGDTSNLAGSISVLSANQMRVVALVLSATGRVVQWDCYDPEGNEVDMSGLMRVRDGELWLRTVQWAHSRSLDAEVCSQWEPAGVTAEDVDRISVFTWPDGEPLRVFVDSI